MRRLIIFLVMYVLMIVGVAASAADGETEWVSIIGLIATPDRYHGKPVHITGWATIQFENTALCLSKDSLSTKECVWLEVPGEALVPKKTISVEQWRKYDQQVISVNGIFDKDNYGHLGAYSGAIMSVSSVYVRQR